MSATKTELTGGNFQDSLGNLLANGYLTMHLSQDCSVPGVGTVCSGIDITVNLDANGNVAAGQYVWSNLVMSPQNNYYKVTGFTVAGQRAFGPNNQQVGSGATFDLGAWIPNTVISWFPLTTQPLLIEVNGVPLSSQSLLDFESSDDSILITDEGGGLLNFQSGGGGSQWQNWLGSNMAGMPPGSFVFSSVNFGLNIGAFNSSRQISGAPTATVLPQVIVQPASLSSSGGVIDGVFNLTLGILQQWFAKVATYGSTFARYWIGFSDQASDTANTAFYGDTPAVNFVGFRYSTPAGDTTFQAVCATSSSITVTDTGVAPTSTPQILKIVPSGSSVTFLIDGTLVATISTNVPANSTPLASIITCDNDDSGSSNTEFGLCYIYAQLSV